MIAREWRRWVVGGAGVAFVALVGVALWKTSDGRTEAGLEAHVRIPAGVMGTTCRLIAVTDASSDVGSAARAASALIEAEARLRAVEARMSVWIEESEVSRLNRAPVGRPTPLSSDTLRVLHVARAATQQTGGAFDATCRPMIELWRRAGRDGRWPSDDAIAAARAASCWEGLRSTSTSVVRLDEGFGVDLGGVAKGYAIDRALEALGAADLRGGLVEVGGDLACFGCAPDGGAWRVEIKGFAEEADDVGTVLGAIRLDVGGAVCTSGDYARFSEIEGRRVSHIVDPRTGRPADAVASVTVVAPDAMTADVWATALSVLGEDGLDRLPDGVEARLDFRAAPPHKTRRTNGFPCLGDLSRQP